MADRLTSTDLDPLVVEREIDDFVRKTGLPRIEAAAAVLRAHGLAVDDLEPTRPLTDEEKERLGVGRSLLDDLPRIAAPNMRRTAS
jgi:hypothetical protein